jgi:RNA polymerase sigma-70 factor (ECF subfamily)
MAPGTDGQLLQAAQRGDATAFEALVHRHESALLRHARALVGESGGYEDVVQEVFLRLAQKPPELPSEAAGDAERERAYLGSWLHRVTRNCCMDALRSDTRRKVREETVATRDEASDGGLHVVEARDTRKAVERGLEKLPGDQHEVLVLRLLGGRSYREIADITGKKVGTVGWLVSEGLKALARDLSPLLALPGGRGDHDAQSVRASASQAPRLRGELS